MDTTFSNFINEQKSINEIRRIRRVFLGIKKQFNFIDEIDTNIIPLCKLFMYLFSEEDISMEDILLLIIYSYLKISKSDINQIDKMEKLLRKNKIYESNDVVYISITNLYIIFNKILFKYKLIFRKKDLFTKKITLPLLDMVHKFIGDDGIEIGEFSDMVLNKNSNELEDFIYQNLIYSSEYDYFFQKLF